MLTFRRQVYFIGITIGVLVSYGIFGILQEKIFRGRFGNVLQSDGSVGEMFRMPITFETVQYIANALAAKGQFFFVDKNYLNDTIFQR